MTDAVLQVLLILVYLAIGLISVTFPIYAISVSFLPQQKWESEKERKKRMGDLTVKISELTAQLKGDKKQVDQIREQLNKYEAEREGTELRYKYLTAWEQWEYQSVFLFFRCYVWGLESMHSILMLNKESLFLDCFPLPPLPQLLSDCTRQSPQSSMEHSDQNGLLSLR
jgi:hypothetical protein